MFDQVADVQVGVDGPSVNDPVYVVIFGKHLSGANGTFLALFVIEIDLAGHDGADKQSRMGVPATVASGTEHEMLYVVIGVSLHLELKLPWLDSPIGIPIDLHVLTDTVRSDALSEDLIQHKSQRWSCQTGGSYTKQENN